MNGNSAVRAAEAGDEQPSQRRILIIEPNAHGHRLFYVRLLIDAALKRGDVVAVGTRADVLSTPEGLQHLAGTGEWRLLPMTTKDLDAIERLSIEVGATTTVVPDGDRVAISLGGRRKWKGSGELSVLVMRESAQPGRTRTLTRLKHQVRIALIRRAAGRPSVRVSVLKSGGWSGASELPAAVDPVVLVATRDDVVRFARQHGLDSDRYWFAVLGALSLRKNIPLVCESIGGLLEGGSVGLLLAGGTDDDAEADVERAVEASRAAGIAVVRLNRLLTDVELDAAVLAVDCVVLAHSNEGPSGLMGKALAAGTRIVAAGARSLQEDAARHRDLMRWVPLERSSLTEALSQATAKPRGVPGLAPDQAQFTGALL